MNTNLSLNPRSHDRSGNATPKSRRSLVQIHPLDLVRGPISLDNDSWVLGRGPDCDVVITDESVSRHHATIRCKEHGSEILDLESTNGTTVNGTLIHRSPLHSGDRIQLGTRVYRFLADDDLESQYQETVYAMMTRDGLTGVYNKRYLTETLDREVARCRRYERPLALLMIGIDQFDKLLHGHGPIAADHIIRGVADRMDTVLRREDVLARLSADRFAVLIVESMIENVVEVADRCRTAVNASPIATPSGPLDVTVSVGVAIPCGDSWGSPDEIVQTAKERLHEATQGGNDRVVL